MSRGYNRLGKIKRGTLCTSITESDKVYVSKFSRRLDWGFDPTFKGLILGKSKNSWVRIGDFVDIETTAKIFTLRKLKEEKVKTINKNTINLNENIIIHCSSKEIMRDLFTHFQANNIRWDGSGNLADPSMDNHWDVYKENTCYYLKHYDMGIHGNKLILTYSDYNYIEYHKGNIYEWEVI